MLSIIILAAGKGTRMKSKLPKVMQPLAGRPLLEHVLLNARELKPSSIIVVYGFGGDQVRDYFKHDKDIEWAHQTEQLGTGHAVKQAIGSVPDQDRVLILYGDVPLISSKILEPLVNNTNNELELLTAIVPDGSGYGRIIRENNRIIGIIEESDADEKVRKINEINTGIMSCRANQMKTWLDKLKNDNKKQEYYLTDIVSLAAKEEIAIHGHKSKIWEESMGINDKSELAKAERLLQKKLATQYMEAGLTLMDPSRIDIRGSLRHGQDVSVDVNVVFEGKVELGNNVTIGPNTYVSNSSIGDNTTIHANSHISGAFIGSDSEVGPFARIRPGADLKNNVKIGNFVEIKKAVIDNFSKVNHLSYIGDATVGKNVNIGAGTITCNYDGANKHKTEIKDDAFIGSGVELVAPIVIGEGATVGAGSTLTKDAEDEKLTVERSSQSTIENWKRPKK